MTLRSFDRLALIALIPGLLLLFTACDSLGGGEATDGSRCVPGESRACACTDGKSGRQVCAQDGKSLGDCECAGAAKQADASVVPTMPPPPDGDPTLTKVPPGETDAPSNAAPASGTPAVPIESLPQAPAPGAASVAMSSPFEPDRSTLLLLHFDEGSGASARDHGIHGLDGTLRSSAWTAGRFGGALQLNGSNANSQSATHEELFPTSSITIEAWIRPETAGDMVIFDVQDTQGLALRARGSDVEVIFTLRLEDRVRTLVSTSPTPVQQWHHVAGTYDGVSMRLWIDGELSGELNAPGALTRAQLCDTPTVGSNCPASGGWFNGAIDEVRVSNIVRYVPVGTDVPGAVAIGTDVPDAGAQADAGSKRRRSKRALNPVDFAKRRARDAKRLLGIQ